MNFNIEWHDRLGSTNAFLRERFSQGMELRSGTIVAAREQTGGRGRQARKWLSSPGQNLCFSLFVETDAELAAVPSLTMAAALAVNDLLRGKGILSAPKWPNDVLVDGKKICGILSERVERKKNRLEGDAPSDPNPAPWLRRSVALQPHSPKYKAVQAGIIVGIGLNVNMTREEAEAIDRPATSMLTESGRAHDLSRTLEELLLPVEHWIGEWGRGGFPNLRKAWTEKAGPIGKPLAVHDGDIKKSGTLAGFGDHGELLLQTADGIETIWSGDVS